MRKTAVLSISDVKKLFSRGYEISENDNIIKLSVGNTFRAIKKIKKLFVNEIVLIKNGIEKEKRFCENVITYNKYSYKRVLPILNKICRQTAAKYNIKLPYMDFYIMASPHIACEIIEKVYDLSRIFTVISEKDPRPGLYDEIYFKHGTLVRQLPEFNNHISEEAVIIRYDKKYYPKWMEIPVIDISMHPEDDMCINAGKISVYDEFLEDLCNEWNGSSGVKLYELIDEYPTENAKVNINKYADEIFLLDTERN